MFTSNRTGIRTSGLQVGGLKRYRAHRLQVYQTMVTAPERRAERQIGMP